MNARSDARPSGRWLDPNWQPGRGPPPEALRRLDQAIEGAMQRLRVRYELSQDEWRGLYISDAQVDALLAGRRGDTGAGPDATGATASEDDTAWSRLCLALQLGRAEADALLCALAPDLDTRYSTLLAYLNDDVGRRWATPELVARLFCPAGGDALDWRSAAGPQGRLFALGVLEWHPMAGEPVGRAARGLRVPPVLSDWLCGLAWADERLDGAAVVAPGTRIPDPEPLADDFASRCGTALRDESRWPLVMLAAPHLGEALVHARRLLRHAGRPVLHIDLEVLCNGSVPASAVASAALLANRLFGNGLLLAPVSALPAGPDGEALATVTRLCREADAVVLADVDRRACRRVAGEAVDRELLEFDAGDPGPVDREIEWRRLLGAAAAGIDTLLLADRFTIGPARMRLALAVARRHAAIDRRTSLDTADLVAAARAVCANASSEMTRSVRSAFEWEDLVLPPPVRERLSDLVRTVELRTRVLDQWGFQRRLGSARGVKAMFAGPSGTGKTMAAALIAKTLAVDLHRVELSATVSKYIGETEKNLDRAFDAARSANAILFIDEADALFGKRSEVKDAHDRYANVETAYLLQKMEDHDGVVILATNLANNIDDAFSRRMQFVVEFPLPDVARREQLWRSMFPAAAPLASDVDFAFLARQFAFAGGDIRNVVLDAAYAAAQREEPIGMGLLLRSVARELAKRGKVAGVSEFREYHALLQAQG